jgi:hypothetical protein
VLRQGRAQREEQVMRAFHHHGHANAADLDVYAHHDARQRGTGRATPWFVLAALAFLAALKAH